MFFLFQVLQNGSSASAQQAGAQANAGNALLNRVKQRGNLNETNNRMLENSVRTQAVRLGGMATVSAPRENPNTNGFRDSNPISEPCRNCSGGCPGCRDKNSLQNNDTRKYFVDGLFFLQEKFLAEKAAGIEETIVNSRWKAAMQQLVNVVEAQKTEEAKAGQDSSPPSASKLPPYEELFAFTATPPEVQAKGEGAAIPQIPVVQPAARQESHACHHGHEKETPAGPAAESRTLFLKFGNDLEQVVVQETSQPLQAKFISEGKPEVTLPERKQTAEKQWQGPKAKMPIASPKEKKLKHPEGLAKKPKQQAKKPDSAEKHKANPELAEKKSKEKAKSPKTSPKELQPSKKASRGRTEGELAQKKDGKQKQAKDARKEKNEEEKAAKGSGSKKAKKGRNEAASKSEESAKRRNGKSNPKNNLAGEAATKDSSTRKQPKQKRSPFQNAYARISRGLSAKAPPKRKKALHRRLARLLRTAVASSRNPARKKKLQRLLDLHLALAA